MPTLAELRRYGEDDPPPERRRKRSELPASARGQELRRRSPLENYESFVRTARATPDRELAGAPTGPVGTNLAALLPLPSDIPDAIKTVGMLGGALFDPSEDAPYKRALLLKGLGEAAKQQLEDHALSTFGGMMLGNLGYQGARELAYAHMPPEAMALLRSFSPLHQGKVWTRVPEKAIPYLQEQIALAGKGRFMLPEEEIRAPAPLATLKQLHEEGWTPNPITREEFPRYLATGEEPLGPPLVHESMNESLRPIWSGGLLGRAYAYEHPQGGATIADLYKFYPKALMGENDVPLDWGELGRQVRNALSNNSPRGQRPLRMRIDDALALVDPRRNITLRNEIERVVRNRAGQYPVVWDIPDPENMGPLMMKARFHGAHSLSSEEQELLEGVAPIAYSGPPPR